MLFIIKNRNYNLQIKNEKIVILKNLCNLSKYKEEDNNILLLINVDIRDGIVTDYKFYLEELFIAIPISLVISNFSHEKVRDICEYHQIPLIEI
ncbi:MAG TPA: hypothetical protein VIK94_02130 [Bacilli bacterium]